MYSANLMYSNFTDGYFRGRKEAHHCPIYKTFNSLIVLKFISIFR